MDAVNLLKSRRSIRKYKPSMVSREVVKSILDLASWAPSAHNAQPWRCIIIDDEGVKARLAREMGRAWLSDMARDGVPREKAEKIVEVESWERITKSPIVIIVCLTMEDMHKYPDRRRRKAEYVMGVQSVAAYIQNLLLSAHYHGLGACWVCAPLFCPNVVKKTLNLPRNFEPQAMITMGYADEQPLPPPRKGVDTVCAFNFWPKSQRTSSAC
ncbi:MAG: nitroreductase family protein [Nitrososphaerota archaeon]|nr:nitroreductase family protein [Nitrososphaerota archaeon]